MDELNRIIEKYIDEVGYFYTDDFSDIKKLSEIILSIREPRFLDKVKTRFGLNKSIDLSYEFFNSFDAKYGAYFQERLNDNAFIFDRVRKNSPANAYSYFDYDLNEKKIYIPYYNQITDAFAIVHETFHDTNLDIENLNYTRNVFTEYISIFGEFLFEVFINDNYDIKCMINNNYSFMACYTKALKVDLQLNFFKCYFENGYIDNYHFNSIINSYPRKYHGLLLRFCRSFIEKKDFDFDYQMRYLYGILLSCYSYDKFLSDDLFDGEPFCQRRANDLLQDCINCKGGYYLTTYLPLIHARVGAFMDIRLNAQSSFKKVRIDELTFRYKKEEAFSSEIWVTRV